MYATLVQKAKLQKKINSDPDRDENTLVYLQNIYKDLLINNSILNKYSFKDNKVTDKAKVLENFLNGIKYLQTHKNENGDPTIEGYSNYILNEVELASFKELMTELVKINPSLGKWKYFAWDENKNSGIGIQKGLDRAVQSLLNALHNTEFQEKFDVNVSKGLKATRQDYRNNNSKASSILQMQVSMPDLDLTDFGEAIGREYIQNQIYPKFAQNITKNVTRNGITTQSSVNGIVSNVGLSANITYTSNSTILNDIITALTEATFTTTYQPFNLKNLSFELYGVNPYLVFMTVAPGATYIRSGRYYRMINCFNRHGGGVPDHSEAPAYFYRIQQIYALTGYSNQRMIRDQVFNKIMGNSMFQAKYIVVNETGDYSGDQIRVYNTSEIISDYLNNIQTTLTISRNYRSWEKNITPEKALSGNIKIEF